MVNYGTLRGGNDRKWEVSSIGVGSTRLSGEKRSKGQGISRGDGPTTWKDDVVEKEEANAGGKEEKTS